MQPKPLHLGAEYGAQFSDPSVVAAYHFRPHYAGEAFDTLLRLMPGPGGYVLDLGCGTGEIARPLAGSVGRVDALDQSLPMLKKGRTLPGGDAANLHWIHGRAENAPLKGPYSLIVAGASLHWMEWDIVFPRFRELLAPGGLLALVGDAIERPQWADRLQPIIDRYSTNRLYRPYNLIDELEQRHLFRVVGQESTAPAPFEQPVEHYVESFHARNGFSRDRMAAADADAFDREVSELVAPYATGGNVTLRVATTVVWGVPEEPAD